jgi:hypothetical protein
MGRSYLVPSQPYFCGGINNNDIVDQAHTTAAMKNLPWDEWVKKCIKCHHCDGQGHICPYCLLNIEKVKSGEIKRVTKHPRPCGPLNVCPPGLPALQCNFMKDPKAEAFFLAFQAFFSNDDCDDEEFRDTHKD